MESPSAKVLVHLTVRSSVYHSIYIDPTSLKSPGDPMDNIVVLQTKLGLHTRASGLSTGTPPSFQTKNARPRKYQHSQRELEACTTSSTTQGWLGEMSHGISNELDGQ